MGDSATSTERPWMPFLRYMFLHPHPMSPETTAFYEEGALIQNPFYPLYFTDTNTVLLLSASPSGVSLQRKFLVSTLVAIAGPPQTPFLERLFVWCRHRDTVKELKLDGSHSSCGPTSVYVLELSFESFPLATQSMFQLLANTHAASALTLIGCDAKVTR